VEVEEEAPMARVPWHLFKARQPRAHLLVAAMEADCLVGPDLQAAQSVLQRFVRKQKPSSDYATTVVREAGRPEVYLAFEDEDDAGKVAAALEAQATVSYLGWASQRVFQLDEAKVATLAASLPAPKTHPRRTPPDGSRLLGRVRRGPKAPIVRDD
jgi:hypothetical protein